jgi:hypothetical protein
MTNIQHMNLTPKTSGYLLTVHYERGTPPQEFAYSDLDDLLNGLTRLLGPIVPVVLGMDLAEPGSDRSMMSLHRSDGTVEALDPDDGWRVWEGEPRQCPPGVDDTDIVEVRLADPDLTTGRTQPANRWCWRWRYHGQRDDIIAYRVVKP